MTLNIRFPQVPDVPTEVPLLGVARTNWTTEVAIDLTRRFGVEAEPRDAGPWLIADDGRASLEIFQNSNSFRFERLDLDGEGRRGGVERLTDAEAVDAAEALLERHPAEGAVRSEPVVTRQEVLVSVDRGEPERIVAGLQVNFRYQVGDLDLLGSGAKAQVTVGEGGEVVSAYRFWRDVRLGTAEAVVAPERAFEVFAAGELLAELDDSTASCEVTDVRLGYLTRPPTDVQGVLLPAYELRGVLSTELLPRYEFTSYVLACGLAPERAKRLARLGSFSERLTR